MSNMARTDEIDKVVSSVRDFVSHKDQQKAKAAERLVLLPDQRISAEAAAMEAAEDALMADMHADDVPDASNVLVLEPDQPADRAGLEATIAELEAAVTAQSDEWEADEGENFAESAWAASAFEAPEIETVEDATAHMDDADEAPQELAVQDDDADAGDDADISILADIDANIDNETLRALVIATVHEELGGEMGERITRNVRKLVRREINRVLASYEIGHD
jgi:hypothetical protein